MNIFKLFKLVHKALFGSQHASVFLAKQQEQKDALRVKHREAKDELIKDNTLINKAKLNVINELALQHAGVEEELKLLKG